MLAGRPYAAPGTAETARLRRRGNRAYGLTFAPSHGSRWQGDSEGRVSGRDLFSRNALSRTTRASAHNAKINPRSTDGHSKSAGFHIDATQANYAENPSSLLRASRYSEAVAGRHARPFHFHGPSSDTGGVLACSQASESRSKHVRG